MMQIFAVVEKNSESKMQYIASYYVKMHEAKVQKEKDFACSWNCKDNLITNLKVKIKLKEEVIKKIMLNESVNTLGICLNPTIEWKDQHGHVKKKIQVTIRKVTRKDMKVHQACMCFNMHLKTNFFGCGITTFNNKNKRTKNNA